MRLLGNLLILLLSVKDCLPLGNFIGKGRSMAAVSSIHDGDFASTLSGVRTSSGEPVTDVAAHLKGKAVALYFSAHWCPPCRRFTPILDDMYAEVNGDEQVLEVIFVSSDNDEQAQDAYMKEAHGDWLTISYDDPCREELKKIYGSFAGKEQVKFPGVQRRNGIPSLVVVNPDGSEVAFGDAACSAVERQGPAVVEGWPKW